MGKLKEAPAVAAVERSSVSAMLQPYRPLEGRRARSYAALVLLVLEVVVIWLVARSGIVVWSRELARLGSLELGLAVAGGLACFALIALLSVRLVNQPRWADQLIRLEHRAWFRAWLTGELYKRNQGRKGRQLTFFGGALLAGLGVWRLSEVLMGSSLAIRYGVPAGIFTASLWFSYRLVNVPRFADFLIATEAEMNKVSWPSWPELRWTTLVVLVTTFALTIVLWALDQLFLQVMAWLKVLYVPK